MYVAFEGLPALGKSELLALLSLYFPGEVFLLPDLVKDVAERERLDILRDRSRLTQAILEAIPEREAKLRRALEDGKTVLEDSHLAVHAAYSAVLDDIEFLEVFRELEAQIIWPDIFVRLDAPLELVLLRKNARGHSVPKEILLPMMAWLSAWHARRNDRVEVVNADQPPERVMTEILQILGLQYRGVTAAEVFPYLMLLGRPAAGKSELIQFFQYLPAPERAQAYHIGNLRVIDDFPFLWQKFREDDLWEELGCGRRYSRRVGENYAVADDHLWDFLILRVNEEIARLPARPGETVIVEFSRGGQGAYARALSRLSSEVLANGAILYLHVSFAESLRRNRARYDRDRRDGILTHSVPDEEMARTYRDDDWEVLAPRDAGYLSLRGFRVPYVTVCNEPEPKTLGDFARRFRPASEELYNLWKNR